MAPVTTFPQIANLYYSLRFFSLEMLKTLILFGILPSLGYSQEFLTAPPPGLRTDGGIWPLPQEIEYLNHSRPIGTRRSRPIQIVLEGDIDDCDILKFTRKTYRLFSNSLNFNSFLHYV